MSHLVKSAGRKPSISKAHLKFCLKSMGVARTDIVNLLILRFDLFERDAAGAHHEVESDELRGAHRNDEDVADHLVLIADIVSVGGFVADDSEIFEATPGTDLA